jgi:hypothetical protein
MIYPHRIRLRGPWECEPLGRITVPHRWDSAGHVRLRRRFGYPGRIDAHERVWLTFPAVEGGAEVRLNGELLGRPEKPGGCEFEVTLLLQPRNELAVELGTTTGATWDGADLEVRCTAFLRGVRVWTEESTLHAAGEVVGTAERPLELYLLRDRSTVAYATAEPTPAGQPFHLAGEAAVTALAQDVRVELVNGAVVWYVWEQRT